MNKLEAINICCQAIDKASSLSSGLPKEMLSIEGMSTPSVRHLLYGLCSSPNCSYLEVGCWKGSTLCSAMSNPNVTRAVAYDNFSEFGGPREDLMKNIKEFIPNASSRLSFREEDFFGADLGDEKYDVYFYDGMHNLHTQYYNLAKVKPHLNPISIVLVDDWDCPISKPASMTLRAIGDFRFVVHFYAWLPKPEFHAGQGLLVLENVPEEQK